MAAVLHIKYRKKTEKVSELVTFLVWTARWTLLYRSTSNSWQYTHFLGVEEFDESCLLFSILHYRMQLQHGSNLFVLESGGLTNRASCFRHSLFRSRTKTSYSITRQFQFTLINTHTKPLSPFDSLTGWGFRGSMWWCPRNMITNSDHIWFCKYEPIFLLWKNVASVVEDF